VDDVWTPVVDFFNAIDKTEHAATRLDFMMFHGAPSLVLAQRFSGTFSARFDEVYTYPFDSAELPLDIEFYGNPSDTVAFDKVEIIADDMIDSSQWKKSKVGTHVTHSNVNRPNGLIYDQIKVRLCVVRISYNSAIDIFAPMLLSSFLSYTSYYMDPKVLPARTTMTVICLLVAVTLFRSNKADLPPSGLLSLVEIFGLLCVMTNLLAVLVFITVHWRIRKAGKAPKTEGEQNDPEALDSSMRKWWFPIALPILVSPIFVALFWPHEHPHY